MPLYLEIYVWALSESVFVLQLCICLFSHCWPIKSKVYDNQQSYNHSIFFIYLLFFLLIMLSKMWLYLKCHTYMTFGFKGLSFLSILNSLLDK